MPAAAVLTQVRRDRCSGKKNGLTFKTFLSAFIEIHYTSVGHGDLKVNGVDLAVSTSHKISHNEDAENVFPRTAANGINHNDNVPTSMSQSCPQVSESSEDTIKRVRSGWTSENANAVTVGELYLMVSLIFFLH